MDAAELRARARQEADAELLRQAASEIAAEWADREAAHLLLDAATVGEIGA